MQSYITYNKITGEITGAFLQAVNSWEDSYLLVDDEIRLNWPLYCVDLTTLSVVLKAPTSVPRDIPKVVTRRQARQALLIRGLLDYVPTSLATIEDPLQRGLAIIEWEDATEFERNRPLVIQIGQALELDEEGLDELFIFANTL